MSATAGQVEQLLDEVIADAAAQGEIEQALDILLPREEGREAPLFAAMRYAAMGGGKWMRGFLVLEGARQFNVARASALRVAAASGFDNCCSFARAFRARYGQSASRFRENGGLLPPQSAKSPVGSRKYSAATQS